MPCEHEKVRRHADRLQLAPTGTVARESQPQAVLEMRRRDGFSRTRVSQITLERPNIVRPWVPEDNFYFLLVPLNGE